jgi:hypothetical protein
MIALVAPILVFLLFLGLVNTLVRGQRGWVLWVKATALLVTIRLGVLWFLLLLHWRGALGLWATPLILVLLPEGILLPRNHVWTAGSALSASVLVAIGSGLWAGATLVVLSIFRRRGKDPLQDAPGVR